MTPECQTPYAAVLVGLFYGAHLHPLAGHGVGSVDSIRPLALWL
jgi:hypothetical protein